MIKLIATSGDLSATGMGNVAATIEVTETHAMLISELQALSSVLTFALDGGYSKELQREVYNKMVAIREQLADGPFTNKYYFRTTWSITQ